MAYADVGETGVSWFEYCIFPYDEVDTHILVFFLHSATSIIIFLTNSIVVCFFLENDIFLSPNMIPIFFHLEQLSASSDVQEYRGMYSLFNAQGSLMQVCMCLCVCVCVQNHL